MEFCFLETYMAVANTYQLDHKRNMLIQKELRVKDLKMFSFMGYRIQSKYMHIWRAPLNHHERVVKGWRYKC